MNDLLRKIYYNPSHPASFSSLQKLFEEAKKKSPNIKIKDVSNWLKGQNTYTLHRQRKKYFKRNKIIAENINEQFQADLVDMQAFQAENNGYKYILTVIDIFSKFAFAIPCKNKTASSIIAGFKKVFKKRKPFKIQTDQGKEFLNKQAKDFFKINSIHHFTSKNEEIFGL
jgi:hypothetical protein